MKSFRDWVLPEEPIEPSCEGLFYRLKIKSFLNKKGEYIYKERMIPLKEMSCKGCLQCECLKWELVNRFTELLSINKAEDGSIYLLTIVNVGHDPETGAVDALDTRFVLQPKENK